MSTGLTKTFDNFPDRTGLPNTATREQLINIGARYLRTDPFEHKGEIKILEQMQLARGLDNYMWKRIVPEKDGAEIPFKIHLEIYPQGYVRHQI